MVQETATALWQARRNTVREALRGVDIAKASLGDFPNEQAAMRKLYHKLNDYILLCYEQIADHGGNPYTNTRKENMRKDT